MPSASFSFWFFSTFASAIWWLSFTLHGTRERHARLSAQATTPRRCRRSLHPVRCTTECPLVLPRGPNGHLAGSPPMHASIHAHNTNKEVH
uniref:Putative secreted protein n=1 Tax=Ixodes ricinus TaxID=34613 RepID=A0A6B0UBW4_IXORI